jgi:hypothetical protein
MMRILTRNAEKDAHNMVDDVEGEMMLGSVLPVPVGRPHDAE